MCRNTCTHTHAHMHTHTYLTWMHTHKLIYLHTHTHTRTNTHKQQTQTQTQTQSSDFSVFTMFWASVVQGRKNSKPENKLYKKKHFSVFCVLLVQAYMQLPVFRWEPAFTHSHTHTHTLTLIQ